jgi:hypothetical protein
MGSSDTQPAAGRAQLQVLRLKSSAERLRMACEMSDEARAISMAGVRHRHPDWTDERVRREVRHLLLGAELAQRVADRETVRSQ